MATASFAADTQGSASFRFEDCQVTVTSADRADLDWLAGFLACGFEPGTAQAGDRQVALTVDARAHDRLLAQGRPGTGERVEGFARDAEPALLERWPSNASTSVFREPHRPIFYRISGDAKRVEILARERTPKCRTTLMRVVRELTMERVVATGGILVHGSAIAVGGGVVVMCGPKRSGKTTLLMAMLEAVGARYVANDRCVLRPAEAGVSVRGLPTLVSIRRDTLERFPAARARLASVRPERAGEGQAQRPSFSLSPPEFCELMGGCPREFGGVLRSLVFPRITDDPKPLTLRRLDPAEARERFPSGLFRAGQASPLGQAFVSRANATLGARPVDFGRITDGVASFECRLGRGQALGPEDCRHLLASVT